MYFCRNFCVSSSLCYKENVVLFLFSLVVPFYCYKARLHYMHVLASKTVFVKVGNLTLILSEADNIFYRCFSLLFMHLQGLLNAIPFQMRRWPQFSVLVQTHPGALHTDVPILCMECYGKRYKLCIYCVHIHWQTSSSIYQGSWYCCVLLMSCKHVNLKFSS